MWKNLQPGHWLAIFFFASLLAAQLFQSIIPFRAPVAIEFQSSVIESMKIEVDTIWGHKTLELKPGNFSFASPLILFQSEIQSIKIKSASTPKVFLGSRNESQNHTPVLFIAEGNPDSKFWVASNLNFSWKQSSTWYFCGIFLGFFFAFWILKILFEFFTNPNTSKTDLSFLALLLTFFGFALYFQWPGVFSYDNRFFMPLALSGETSPHTPLLFVALYTFSTLFFADLSGFTVINLILATVTFVFVFRLISKNRRAKWCFLAGLLFFLLSQSNRHFLLFQNRDITFSWLFILWLLMLYRDLKVSTDRKHSLECKLLFLLCCFLRLDTIAILPFYFFIDARFFPAKKSILLARNALLFLIVFGYIYGSPQLRELHSNARYRMTAYINPLLYIIKHQGPSALTEDEKIRLAPYWNLPVALQKYEDHNIKPLSNGSAIPKDQIDTQAERAFREVTLSLIMRNPWQWIKNRAQIFWGMIDYRNQRLPSTREIATYNKSDSRSILLMFPPLKNSPESWFLKPIPFFGNNLLGKWLFMSAVPALIILGFSLFFIGWEACWAIPLWMLLLRSAVVIALAPATLPKYLWSLSIFAIILPALILLNRKASKIHV